MSGGAVVLSSLSPRKGSAQQAIRSVIGFLQPGTPEAGANIAAAFRKGLSESGYDEGRNLVIDYRWRTRYPHGLVRHFPCWGVVDRFLVITARLRVIPGWAGQLSAAPWCYQKFVQQKGNVHTHETGP